MGLGRGAAEETGTGNDESRGTLLGAAARDRRGGGLDRHDLVCRGITEAHDHDRMLEVIGRETGHDFELPQW